MLGPRLCARALSSCGKRGPLLIVVYGPLTIAASLVAEHRLQTRRLSSRGSQAQLLHGMWDPPRPGLETMSPALAGRPSTTAPPGKPFSYLNSIILYFGRKGHKVIFGFSKIIQLISDKTKSGFAPPMLSPGLILMEVHKS